MVPIQIGTNMTAGNQQQHLSALFINAGRLTEGLVAVSFHAHIAGGRVNGFLLQIAREKGIHEKNDNSKECVGVGEVPVADLGEGGGGRGEGTQGSAPPTLGKTRRNDGRKKSRQGN